MPKIQTNGIDLFYDVQGVGEPLLLLAGFLCDHSYWSLVMPSLVKQYQVIRLDNRGMGRSSAPDSPYSIQQMANDAVGVLEQLGITKVHVAGHSMGGQIAQELVLRHPEKISSLMLHSSWAKCDGLFHAVIETWGELLGTLDLKLYEKVVLPWIFTDTFYSTPGMIEAVIDMAINYPFPPTTHGVYHQSRAILSSNTSTRLQDIHCPTLVVVGRQDILTPIKFSEQLVQGIPNAKLVILEDVGHGFLVESPDTLARTMLSFLETVSIAY
jgi:pimeloyl-ACP methyl ester carboxylesterase